MSIVKTLFFIFFILVLPYCDTPGSGITRRTPLDPEPVRTSSCENNYGEYNSSDYDGPDCDDLEDEEPDKYRECKQICRTLYGSRKLSDCEKINAEFISTLENLFEEMKNLSINNRFGKNISTIDFGVMIDIGVEPVIELIKNEWQGERVIKEFLIWIATHNPVALALEQHDEQNQILKEAFSAIGKQKDNLTKIEHGFSQNLAEDGTTFLTLASTSDKNCKNAASFKIAHQLLIDVCSQQNDSKQCKLKNYCLRQEFERRSLNRNQQCHYRRVRTFERENHCYVQKPTVWSYWTSLNKEEELYDSDFTSTDILNKDTCNNEVCSKINCQWSI